MTKVKLENDYIEVKPNVVVSWFDNDHYGDRGDPFTTKVKDVILNKQSYRNIYVTIKMKKQRGYFTIMKRLIKEGSKYYVRKNNYDSSEDEFLKEVLLK